MKVVDREHHYEVLLSSMMMMDCAGTTTLTIVPQPARARCTGQRGDDEITNEPVVGQVQIDQLEETRKRLQVSTEAIIGQI